MNDVWNLDPIYKGFDDPAFLADFDALKQQAAAYNAFAAKLADMDAAKGLCQGIAMQEALSHLIYKLAGYASLRQAANTKDPDAGSQMGRIMAAVSDISGAEAAFQDWAAKLPNLMELVKREPQLRAYEFLFTNMAESSRYLLPGMGEEIMAKMRLSGGDAWSDLQQYLTSTVLVTYRGQTITLSAIRNLAYDAEASVRKDAYEAELACYERIRDAVAYAMNSLKLETISDCQLRGYASALERTLKHSHMEKATLDAMLSAMD